jgi:hypothetical protein
MDVTTLVPSSEEDVGTVDGHRSARDSASTSEPHSIIGRTQLTASDSWDVRPERCREGSWRPRSPGLGTDSDVPNDGSAPTPPGSGVDPGPVGARLMTRRRVEQWLQPNRAK